jgi:hypothetical protein
MRQSRDAKRDLMKFDQYGPSRLPGTAFAPPGVVSSKRDVRLSFDVELRGQPYVLTITPESFKLARRGQRNEIELPWTAFLDEDAAMMSALHASMRNRRRSEK